MTRVLLIGVVSMHNFPIVKTTSAKITIGQQAELLTRASMGCSSKVKPGRLRPPYVGLLQ